MKKLLTFLMMSVLAIGVGWAATTWQETSAGSLTTGDIVVIVDKTSGKAMSNDKGTSSAPTATAVTINGTELNSPAETLQWEVTLSNGNYKFNVPGTSNYLYCNANNNGVRVGSSNNALTNNVFTIYNNSGVPFLKNTATSRYLGVYTGQDWRCYESINSNIKDCVLAFYKKVEQASSVATPVISGTTPFVGSTQVSISCETSGASIYYTTDGNDPTTSSTLYSAPFTINTTATVKAIAVLNGQTSNIASKTFTALQAISSIAEFNGLTVNDNFKYTGNNIVYIISNSGGNNHYVQDGSKGMLIFGSLGQTYQPGDVIPAGFTGTRGVFNDAPEMTNPDGFTTSSQNVGLTPMEITPSQVNLDNFGRYAIIKNAAFNTSAKTITAGGETIGYHTTFMTAPTDGAVYDVIGVCGYYKPNNGTAYPQFLPISVTPAVTTGPDYYLIGSFNGWAQQDENYKFTARADGSYVLDNKTLPDGVRFKILKVDGNDVSWLGGSAGDYFGITKDVCTNIQLVDGADFYMEVGGNCTFTVSADLKLTVSKEAQLFLAGTFNNWGKTDALEATSDGWAIEKELSVDDEFKFVDEWGSWYGGGNTIAEVNLGATIALNTGGNFKMGVDGNFVINVAANKSSFVITRKAETSTAMFDFDNDYATLFPNLPGTSSSSSTDGDFTEDMTAIVGGVSLTVSTSTTTTPNRIWNSSPRLRMYGGTITITAPEGYNLTRIEISQGKWNTGNSADEGTLTSTSWTGETHILVITIAGNTQFKNMNVTIAKANANAPVAPVIEGESPFVGSTEVTITCATNGASVYYTTDGNDPTSSSTLYQGPFTINESVTVKAIAYSEGGVPSTITTKEFVKTPSVATIAEYKQLAAGTTFVFTGNVAVTYVNGKYLYVKDDTGSALIFGNSNFDFTQGQVLEAGWKAETTVYYGLLEAKNPEDVSATDQTVEITPEEKAVNAISTANDNEYIIVTNVSIDEPVNKNFTITDANGKTIVGRTNFTGVDHPSDLDAKYDIICLVGEYNGTVQLYPTEYNAAAVIEPVVLDGVAFTAARQWATWYGDANLALPEDVTAYVVTGVQGDAVSVEALDYIPAGTGVLLYSETAAESVSAMPYTGEAGTIPTNLLVGSLEAQNVSNAYLLYNNQFILAQDGTTVGAHRCYLPMSASAQGVPVLKIGTPGTVTGIETISTNGNGDNTYYNLMGQPVANPTPGIYIRGGKKVIVK